MAKDDLFGTKTRKNKGGFVLIKKDSDLYSKMKDLTKAERSVLDFLIKEMAEDLNTVIIGRETRELLLKEASISRGTVSNVLSKLKEAGFIGKTVLPNEYVVSPLLAVSGSEFAIYRNLKRYERELKDKK